MPDKPDKPATVAIRWLLAIGFASSIAPTASWFFGGHWRLGFLLAGICMGAAVATAAVTRNALLRRFVRENRLLVLAAAGFVLARLVSVLGAEVQWVALLDALRAAAVVAYLLLVLALGDGDAGLARLFARVAAVMVAAHLLLFFAGLLAPSAFGCALEWGLHQHLGGMPRFAGVPGCAFSCGVLMLACAALVRWEPVTWLRWAAWGCALALALASLSFATLVVPIAIAWGSIRRARWRWALTGVLVLGGLAVLWIKPLSVSGPWGETEISALHPGYHTRGMGPRHMPRHTLELGGLAAEFHFTAYAYLARRSLRCFAENWAIGAGGRNHPVACPVWTMNTYGSWTNHRIAHNEYLKQLAEHGLLGADHPDPAPDRPAARPPSHLPRPLRPRRHRRLPGRSLRRRDLAAVPIRRGRGHRAGREKIERPDPTHRPTPHPRRANRKIRRTPADRTSAPRSRGDPGRTPAAGLRVALLRVAGSYCPPVSWARVNVSACSTSPAGVRICARQRRSPPLCSWLETKK